MKSQYPCPSMCATAGILGLAGYWWRAEDGVRLLRMLVRPLLIAVVIVAVAAALLLGGRSLAPFVIGGGIGNPAHMSTMSTERASAERDLQAEAALLLESFEPPVSGAPASNGELP
ncbi:MAG: hypothetical protein M3457_11490 [Chloroflexota bacterium]|nr:hypothetical protein [Chloroflexota bacterium]